MKRSISIFGIILLAQSVLCVPVRVDETYLEPELQRGFMDFLLSLVSRPLVGLATTGEQLISPTINGVANFGTQLLNNVFGVPSSSPVEYDSPPMIVEREEVDDDDQLLDVLDALVDQAILDQPIGTTESLGSDGQMLSLDEIDERQDEIYLVVVE